MVVERLAKGRAFHNVVQSAFLTDLAGATGFTERGWQLTAGGRGSGTEARKTAQAFDGPLVARCYGNFSPNRA